MDAPQAWLVVRFAAARADDRAIREPHGLVLDWPQHPVGQPPRLSPRPSGVGGRAHDTPPVARVRADLVEERERAIRHLEQHRVPARVPRAVGLHAGRDLDRRRPRAFDLARHPDADVRGALARAPEHGRHQPVARLRDGRGVHAREGRLVVEELGLEDGGLGRGLRRARSVSRRAWPRPSGWPRP